jgi:hypothetical protein
VSQSKIASKFAAEQLSGCKNVIPAATNVSNAMVVFLTQSDNIARRNFFGYDKILLIGYDYSWKANGKYYAFDHDGGGKRQYMQHSFIVTPSGEFAYTSGNLAFSKDWLEKYVRTYNLPVIQCGKDSLLTLGKTSDLEAQIKYRYKVEDATIVKNAILEMRKLEAKMQSLHQTVLSIGKDHWWAHARSV